MGVHARQRLLTRCVPSEDETQLRDDEDVLHALVDKAQFQPAAALADLLVRGDDDP